MFVSNQVSAARLPCPRRVQDAPVWSSPLDDDDDCFASDDSAPAKPRRDPALAAMRRAERVQSFKSGQEEWKRRTPLFIYTVVRSAKTLDTLLADGALKRSELAERCKLLRCPRPAYGSFLPLKPVCAAITCVVPRRNCRPMCTVEAQPRASAVQPAPACTLGPTPHTVCSPGAAPPLHQPVIPGASFAGAAACRGHCAPARRHGARIITTLLCGAPRAEPAPRPSQPTLAPWCCQRCAAAVRAHSQHALNPPVLDPAGAGA
jgi:hypothetical protein